MARPPLPAAERRDDRLPNLRVTAAERADVERLADAAGLTLVEYCRRAIFKAKVAPRRSDTDHALLVALNRVGTNLNQIAHTVHCGRNLPPDFSLLVAELRALVEQVAGDGS